MNDSEGPANLALDAFSPSRARADEAKAMSNTKRRHSPTLIVEPIYNNCRMRSILYYYVVSGIGVELILGGAGRGGAVAVVNYYASFISNTLLEITWGFLVLFAFSIWGLKREESWGSLLYGHQPTEQ